MANATQPLILGFVGEIASGKGTACDFLIKEYHAGYHRFSTILRDVLDRLFIEQSRTNLQQLSTILRQTFGEDLMAKVMASEVTHDPAPIVCVDGIRRPADIIHLQQLPNFHIIYITADERTRYERLLGREENTDDAKKSFAEFQKEAQAETEQQIKAVGQSAKITINNNGDRDALFTAIRNTLTTLGYADTTPTR